MSIFNSLGSNYNKSFILKSLIQKEDGSKEVLKRFLEKKYAGNVFFFYKARQAITAALQNADLPKDAQVAITGFTCIAVVDAIKSAELTPFFLDIDSHTLNFTLKTLEESVLKNPNIKAVIIQNTLGYPCEGEEIALFCKKKKLVLIEDLAHATGAYYSKGKEVGMLGNFTILSFSQDKGVDAVSGGALIDRHAHIKKALENEKNTQPSFQDHFYPLFTWIIRNTYQLGIGKLLHKILIILGLLKNPMIVSQKQNFTNWHAMLALESFHTLEKNLSHRKFIASVFAQNLPESVLSLYLLKNIKNSSNLRFPIFVEKRAELIRILKLHHVYVSDIWYDAPIAPKKYLENSGYKTRQCPNAEEVSRKIINLPTHIQVSEKDALRMANTIRTFYTHK